jgi:bifunctional non-homologous end joining protein LigD
VRHGSFVGLRSDKKAREVVPEKPAEVPEMGSVKITSRDRVIFPESGQTKGELADYYQAVAR